MESVRYPSDARSPTRRGGTVARVTLQEYIAEARARINERAYDQAIAICRDILRRYPTHIKTYQVLGEACLEKGDFDEAESIFKRLLGQADPENFVAYAGLGVIREEQGQYAEAIWYMERAFELIPNRDEVRSTLRRLYGKRDGTEPTRIKLNKAALARLYARGGQFRQAIQELRTLLSQEPYLDRIDLKLSLAETLWRDEQREQAAEMSRQVLEICPNCLKAMLLVGQIQLSKGQTQSGRDILNETRRLDPENIAAQALFESQSPMPLTTVRIPRMPLEPDEEIVPLEAAADTTTGESETLLESAATEVLADQAAVEEELPWEQAPPEAPSAEPVVKETPPAEEGMAGVSVDEEAEGAPGDAPTASEAVEQIVIERQVVLDQAMPEDAAVSSEALPAEETIEDAIDEAVALLEDVPRVAGAVAEVATEGQALPGGAPTAAGILEAAPPCEPAVVEEEPSAVETTEETVSGEAPSFSRIPTAQEASEEVAQEDEEPFKEARLSSDGAPGDDETLVEITREEEVITNHTSPALAPVTPLESLSEVERLKVHLEQMPKDHETRLLLARAYRDQEQMKLALEQYGRLMRSKRSVLSEALQDVESIVASRPENLDAHELLADLYAKNGQLQEAVDRYRWILRRLEAETE
jgi:tetratricopeptide (TPR) repeat protein